MFYNRYVIALNHVKIAYEDSNQVFSDNASKMTIKEVNKLMNFVRKYPYDKINKDKLFTYGFSNN